MEVATAGDPLQEPVSTVGPPESDASGDDSENSDVIAVTAAVPDTTRDDDRTSSETDMAGETGSEGGGVPPTPPPGTLSPGVTGPILDYESPQSPAPRPVITTDTNIPPSQGNVNVNVNVNVHLPVTEPGRSNLEPKEARPRKDDGLYEDCAALKMPAEFSSFSGRPASNVADCSWDFFGCTEKYGVWPTNKRCCEERFAQCSVEVQPQPQGVITAANCREHNHTHTHLCPREPPVPASSPTLSSLGGDGRRKDGRRDEDGQDELLSCIWSYTSCSSSPRVPEATCRSRFLACSSTSGPGAGSASQVAGLAGDTGFPACISQLYGCTGTRGSCREALQSCVKSLPTQEQQSSSPPKSSLSPSSPSSPSSSPRQPGKFGEAGDRRTPSLAQGAGKVPESEYPTKS